MNNFTKEELDELRSSRCYHLDNNFPYEDSLFMKIQSMIDNYCEHETTYTDYDSQPIRCKKCLNILDE